MGERESGVQQVSLQSDNAFERRQQFHRHSRVTSTVAQNFAADLDSMFGLSKDVDTLSQTVEDKRRTVSSGQTELEQLEAKLRETERRLARVSRHNSPSRQPLHPTTVSSSQNTSAGESQIPQQPKQPHPLAQKPTYPDDRPATAGAQRPTNTRVDTDTLMSSVPGGMPRTPSQYSGRDDYVMVDTGSA